MKREPKTIDVGGTQILHSNCWRTPWWLWNALHVEFGCNLDAAARAEDALCANYLGPDHVDPERRDAIAVPWPDVGDSVFVNPPFKGGIGRWVNTMADAGLYIPVCAVLPATPSTAWFRTALETAYELRLFEQRVNCNTPEGVPSTSARGDICVFVWLPRAGGGARTRYWDPIRFDRSDNPTAEESLAVDHLMETPF